MKRRDLRVGVHGLDTHRQESKVTLKYPGQEGENLFPRFCIMLYATWELVELGD